MAITGPDGELLGTATLPELRRLATRGCPTHGAPNTACGCPVLGAPPPVDRYRPTPAHRRFLTTRDRTCRHPGCTTKAGWADPASLQGPAASLRAVGGREVLYLCCLCRRHHRLKTHARGWRFALDPDGTLHVTTPSGVTRTERPPGLHPAGHHATDPDPPPF